MNRKQAKMLRRMSEEGILGMSLRAAKRMFNGFDHKTKGALRASFKQDVSRRQMSVDEGAIAPEAV